MTQHERSAGSVRAARARWAKTPPEERVWTAHFLRSHQKRLQGLVPALPPKPVRMPVPNLSTLLPKLPTPPKPPAPPPIPVVVIPRRARVIEPMRRPGIRYDV